MDEYILQPEDRVCVLDGQTLEVFCDGRTMIFFTLAQLDAPSLVLDVPCIGGLQPALRLAGPDSLMAQRYAMLIPQTHPDFAALRAQLPVQGAPALYRKPTCDHTGPHRH